MYNSLGIIWQKNTWKFVRFWFCHILCDSNLDKFLNVLLKFNPDDEHEREHMLEHLKAQIGDKDTKDMTADELQFYYFNNGSQWMTSLNF